LSCLGEEKCKNSIVTKNLFLVNKRKQELYLVVVASDTVVDFKFLASKLDAQKANHIRMADDEYLSQVLCVKRGCVTLLSLAHAAKPSSIPSGWSLSLVIDEKLKAGQDIWMPLMASDITIKLSNDDVIKFIGHFSEILKIQPRWNQF
jgi:hypothetical protein